MHHTVPAVVHIHPAAHLGIARFILRQQRAQRTPATQVTPSELRRQHKDILRLLHHRIVDGNLLASREEALQLLRLFVRKQGRLQLVHHSGNLRRIPAYGIRNRVRVPHKNPRVPEIIPRSQIPLCRFHVRFLPERLHLADPLCVRFSQSSYVPVSRFRSGRLHPQGHDSLRVRRLLQCHGNAARKLRRINHQRIRRRHHDVRLRKLLSDLPARIRDTRRCIPCFRFRQNMLSRNLRQLFLYYVDILFRCHHPEILFRADILETLHRELNQRFSYPHYVDKLFGIFGCAHGPETASYSACHDNYMILHAGFCIVFCFLVPAENVTRIYFVFHIIQTRIIAVGNDGMCLSLELIQIVYNL